MARTHFHETSGVKNPFGLTSSLPNFDCNSLADLVAHFTYGNQGQMRDLQRPYKTTIK